MEDFRSESIRFRAISLAAEFEKGSTRRAGGKTITGSDSILAI
jgi:hypothetical protein